MKKLKEIIIIFLIFIFIYFIQINIFNNLQIFNVKPNLFIIFIFSIGIKYSKTFASIIGIIIGILLDLLISNKVGVNMILYGFVGFLTSCLSNYLISKNKLTNILLIFFSTIFLEIFNYIFYILFFKTEINLIAFFSILIIESIYNILLFIIIYPLWKKILWKNINNDNKLIRYL